MSRGGYQAPSGPRPPAGPGRFSQRTDGNQPVRTPGLDDPSVQYGDVQKMRAAQSAIPLPEAGGPSSPAGAASARPISRSGGLPPFLFDQPSGRPNEPGTAGLSTGPGPGPEVLPAPAPDERVQVLQYLYQRYGNQQALEQMQKIMDETQQQYAGSAAPVPGRPA